MQLFSLFLTAFLIQNVVLVRFLGVCPVIGASKKLSTAFGAGVAVVFVILASSLITWALESFLLIPYELMYMRTFAFVLVIVVLLQIVELFLRKVLPSLYKGLGMYLPLITTNCAVLGTCLLISKNTFSLLETAIYAFGAGLGFLLAIILMSGIQERLEDSNIPEYMKGAPIMLVSAGLIALVFCAFSGIAI